jgi:hypothetical protein
MTPWNVTDLTDHNSGDAAGDMGFLLDTFGPLPPRLHCAACALVPAPVAPPFEPCVFPRPHSGTHAPPCTRWQHTAGIVTHAAVFLLNRPARSSTLLLRTCPSPKRCGVALAFS